MCSSAVLRFLTTTIVAASVVLACARSATVHAVETQEMANTTSALERYERLYTRLDVEIERHYTARDGKLGGIDRRQPSAGVAATLLPQRAPVFRFVDQFGVNEVLKRNETIHLVSQDEKLRMDWKSVDRYENDTTRSWRRVLLCDGKATRFYADAPLRQCWPDSQILKEIENLQPHRIFFRYWDPAVPLSRFLKSDRSREVIYQGEEEYQGLKCRRIRITHLFDQGRKRSHLTDVWLAETRNLIPARTLEYRLLDSEDQPGAEATVGQWQEIKPGIWFPTSAVVTKYNPAVPKDERAKKPRWVERYTVKRVSLDPRYDAAFFQESDRVP